MDKQHQSESFWVLTIALTFLLGIFLDSFSGFHRECRHLQEDVLRLHILANSDSEADQRVKLAVRDAVLAEESTLFYHADTKADAEQLAEQHLDQIVRTAGEVLAAEGFSYGVRAEVREIFFDTRVYDGFTMPAGRYHALQITLGEGKGHNWWCVLYPPLCVGAAAKISSEMEQFTPEERRVLEAEPAYEVRFFLVEIWERLENFLTKSN